MHKFIPRPTDRSSIWAKLWRRLWHYTPPPKSECTETAIGTTKCYSECQPRAHSVSNTDTELSISASLSSMMSSNTHRWKYNWSWSILSQEDSSKTRVFYLETCILLCWASGWHWQNNFHLFKINFQSHRHYVQLHVVEKQDIMMLSSLSCTHKSDG